MSRKETCGCRNYEDKGHERVALCSEHEAEAKTRHDAFVTDMQARTAREALADQFV